MIIPYNVDVPMTRLPVANWALITVTTLISFVILAGLWPRAADPDGGLDRIWQKVDQKNRRPQDFDEVVLIQKIAKEDPLPLALKPRAFSVWQLFTHIFEHADLIHLAGNMFFLFVFGNAVNAKLGHGWFLLSYLLLGAFAGAAWLVLGDGRPAVGASGAIMGLMGIFFVLFPRNEVRVFYWLFLFAMGVFSIGAVWLILFYMTWDLIGTVWYGDGEVAYVCHLAGALAGVAGAAVVIKARWVESTNYEENLLQTLGFHEKEPHDEEIYWALKKSSRRMGKKRRGTS